MTELNLVPNRVEDGREVGTAKLSPRAEVGERVELVAGVCSEGGEGVSAEERNCELRRFAVDGDVGDHILVHLLREIHVDAEEVGVGLSLRARERVRRRSASRSPRSSAPLPIAPYLLELLEQSLEPLERAGIAVAPDEVDATEGAELTLLLHIPAGERGIRSASIGEQRRYHIAPDVLEDGSERRDSNASADEDRDCRLGARQLSHSRRSSTRSTHPRS